jgi:hypothetical protein
MTVHDRPTPVRRAALAACALAAAAALQIEPLAAAERHRPVPVSRAAGDAIGGTLKLHDAASDTWAPIRVENPGLAIGDRVVVCAVAEEGGYFSIWSRTGDGELPVRVFPNDYTPEQRKQRGGRIDAGQEVCLGDGTDGYRFSVTEPYGDAEVYLYWSPELEGQFGPEDIPIIPEYGVEETARSASGGYSATVLRYRVVE